MLKKINVVIVDDHEIFREGIKTILNSHDDIEIVGEASDGQEFLNIIEKIMPDVVLMDIIMPVMDGLQATIQGLNQYPLLKILVVSMYGEEDHILSMLEAGVRGFVPKTVNEEELYRAIKYIYEGKNYFSQELLGTITQTFLKKNAEKKEVKEKRTDIQLTGRELEVLKYVAKGLTNKEISEILLISQKTVDGHKSNLLDKTNSKNVVGLIIWALHNKLIEL